MDSDVPSALHLRLPHHLWNNLNTTTSPPSPPHNHGRWAVGIISGPVVGSSLKLGAKKEIEGEREGRRTRRRGRGIKDHSFEYQHHNAQLNFHSSTSSTLTAQTPHSTLHSLRLIWNSILDHRPPGSHIEHSSWKRSHTGNLHRWKDHRTIYGDRNI